jgi:hypothetical protein
MFTPGSSERQQQRENPPSIDDESRMDDSLSVTVTVTAGGTLAAAVGRKPGPNGLGS